MSWVRGKNLQRVELHCRTFDEDGPEAGAYVLSDRKHKFLFPQTLDNHELFKGRQFRVPIGLGWGFVCFVHVNYLSKMYYLFYCVIPKPLKKKPVKWFGNNTVAVHPVVVQTNNVFFKYKIIYDPFLF